MCGKSSAETSPSAMGKRIVLDIDTVSDHALPSASFLVLLALSLIQHMLSIAGHALKDLHL